MLASSKHPAEAAKFALWLNTDPAALALENEKGGLYPADKAGLEMPALSKGVPFYGGQKVFDVFKEASANVDTNFTWGPIMTDTNRFLSDGFTKSLNGQGTWRSHGTTPWPGGGRCRPSSRGDAVEAPPTSERVRRRRPWVWFLLPFLVPFVLFYLVPIAYAIYRSLFKIERTGGLFGESQQVFAGFEQYANVFSDDTFRAGVLRVLLFGIVQVPIMLTLALVTALLLDSAVARLKRFFRIAFFVPYGIPGVIAALMWAFLYSPQLSPIVSVLDQVGTAPDFLGSNLILWSIANVTTWTYTGYNMLIILAALQALPQEIFEASRIDGAGGIRTAFSIKIPLVFPALVLTTVFSIIGTLQLFTEPVVFQTISRNVTSGYTPNMQAYAVAASNNYSFSAALSVVLAVATFILSFGFLKFTQRRGEAL